MKQQLKQNKHLPNKDHGNNYKYRNISKISNNVANEQNPNNITTIYRKEKTNIKSNDWSFQKLKKRGLSRSHHAVNGTTTKTKNRATQSRC